MNFLRGLYFASVLFLAATLASTSKPGHDRNAWKAAARYISEFMDRTASPCSDVDRFVCAKFGLGSDEYQFNFADQAVVKVREFGKAVESVELNHAKTPAYARLVRQFYDECSLYTDNPTTIREAYGVLKEALGEFPVIEEQASNSTVESIWYFMGRMQQRLGRSVGLSASLESSPLAIRNEIPEQEFPMDYFRNQIVRVATSLRKNVDTVRLVKMMLESRALFNDWRANASVSSTGSPVLVKFVNLTDIIPEVDWHSYFRGLFPDQESFELWLDADPDVSLIEPELTRTIARIFRRHSLRAVKMLMYGKTFQTLMADYVKDVDQAQSALLALKPNLIQTRSMRCLTYIMDNMPVAATRVLFDYMQVEPLHWRNDILLMSENIFSAMRLLLNSISYLSSITKEKIQRKLDAITIRPPIPSWIMDDRRAMRNALNYNGTQSLFMKNVEKVQSEFGRQIDKFIPKPVDISMASPLAPETEDPPPTFEQNFFFTPSLEIKLYLGFCLPPNFHVDYPLAVKYGFLGALIAHELMHGFGVQGVRESGELGQPLLNEEELQIYDRHKQCLVSQYSQTCFRNGHCLVGEKAVEENIADIGGLKVAYSAYRFTKMVTGDEPSLPGLERYTSDQLFFITYERFYCSRNAPPEAWMSEEHTPDAARGPVALRNNPHFAAAFECTVGSPYAPVRPCEMWGDILESRAAQRS